MIPPRRAVALLAALLLLAAPAGAQRHETHTRETTSRMIRQDGSHKLEVVATGEVDFSDEGDWVRSVAPGARLTVEETGRGDERRIEFTRGEDGGVRVRYRVDGRERPLDAEGRAWARRHILEAVRENGIGAERRVRSIRERRGVGGVLDEIGRLRGDVGRRMYYRALLSSGPMGEGDFVRVMEDLDRRMRSDVERRLVLYEAVDQADGPRRLASVLRAAGEIDSDVETRLVLYRALERHRLADAESRAAFFRALGGVGSDVERRLVLYRAAERRELAEGAGRDDFFRAVDAMRSDVERRLVLSSVLREGASEATVLAVLRSARGMGSDVEQRLVLGSVPAAMLRSPRVAEAYREAAESIGSEHERRIALRRLGSDR